MPDIDLNLTIMIDNILLQWKKGKFTLKLRCNQYMHKNTWKESLKHYAYMYLNHYFSYSIAEASSREIMNYMFCYFSLFFIATYFKPLHSYNYNNIGLLNYTFAKVWDLTNFLLQAHLTCNLLIIFDILSFQKFFHPLRVAQKKA